MTHKMEKPYRPTEAEKALSYEAKVSAIGALAFLACINLLSGTVAYKIKSPQVIEKEISEYVADKPLHKAAVFITRPGRKVGYYLRDE